MRASSVVESTSLIELVGYEYAGDVDRDALAAAWRAGVDAQRRPADLVYRELSLQRHDWNELIRAEITNPNPFTVLDYTVFRSADPSARSAVLMLPGDPKITTGVFTIAARFARPEAAGEPGTLLYNLFRVEGDASVAEAFIARWPERAEYQAQQAGFCSALLHREAVRGQSITAFNRAEWRDAAHYADTLAGFERRFPRTQRAAAGQGVQGPPPVRSFLGLFQRLDARVFT